MKYARIENNVVMETIDFDPTGLFHESLMFVACPDEVDQCWSYDGATFTAPDPVTPSESSTPDPVYVKVTPVQFKLLFTTQERLAIKAAKETDPVIQDAYEILEDPRLTEVDFNVKSNRDLLDYFLSKGLLAADRVSQILAGEMQ